MPWDFAFDPITNDLIDDEAGGFELTFTAQTMMQLELQCEFGNCWQDATQGALFYDLGAFTPNPAAKLLAEAQRATGVLVARGRIDTVQIATQQISPSRVDVQISARDTSTGQVISTVIKPGIKG